MFAAVCDLGLEGIVSKRLDAPYRSGCARSWIKVKNPKSPVCHASDWRDVLGYRNVTARSYQFAMNIYGSTMQMTPLRHTGYKNLS